MLLGCPRLLGLLIIRSEELLQIGRHLTFPGDAEHCSLR